MISNHIHSREKTNREVKMMKTNEIDKSRLLVLSLVTAFMILASMPTDVESVEEGRAYTFTFDEAPDDLDPEKAMIKITLKLQPVQGSRTDKDEITIEFKVTPGMTPKEKATEFYNKLEEIEAHKALLYRPPNGCFTVQVKEEGEWNDKKVKDIVKVVVSENTGETIRAVDAPGTYPMTVTYDIEGTPVNPDGAAILKIGLTYPLVSVPTYGKSPEEIKSDLVSLFNELYHETSFVARINCRGAVEISDVPCKEGVTAGAYDTGLTWTLSMSDSDLKEPVFTGVHSIFDFHYDVVDLYVRVNDEDYSKMIYDIEILREDQDTTWTGIDVVETPEGWDYEELCCGVRFFTETNPLVQCQRVKFSFRVDAEKISWYIKAHVTDEAHVSIGMIVSVRWRLHYFYLV